MYKKYSICIVVFSAVSLGYIHGAPTQDQLHLFTALDKALGVANNHLPTQAKALLFKNIAPLLDISQFTNPFKNKVEDQTGLDIAEINTEIKAAIPTTAQAYADKFVKTIEDNGVPIAQGFSKGVKFNAGDPGVTGVQQDAMIKAAQDLLTALQLKP